MAQEPERIDMKSLEVRIAEFQKFINYRQKEYEWTLGEVSNRVKMLNELWARCEEALLEEKVDPEELTSKIHSRVTLRESYLRLLDNLENRRIEINVKSAKSKFP